MLTHVAEEVRSCVRCPLHKSRTNAVPGEGGIEKGVMFIGEAPGKSEDEQGRPFVGRAGQLLTELIEMIGWRREDVYITNVVKCRPPGNRDPEDSEIEACLPYLKMQIMAIKPRLIVALGRHSAKTLYREAGLRFRGVTVERGSLKRVRLYGVDTTIFVTYHPAAALYNPRLREALETDFQKIKKFFEGGGKRRTLDDFF